MLSSLFHNTLFTSRLLRVKIILFLLVLSSLSFSQEKKRIEILRSKSLESVPNRDVNTQRLVDSVKISHEDILIWCDTAYIYSETNRVNAIGRVHIKQGDTLHLYANNIFYDGDQSFARAWNNVKLINKTTTLYSDTVDYDLEQNIGYYDDHGKIIDSTTTLVSEIGRYHIDEDQIYFFKNVEGYNEEFTLKSDTVTYNTVTGKMFVEGPTTIKDTANTLYTEKGWYDSNTGESELKKKSVVYGKTQKLEATYIKYNKEKGNGKASGNVRIEDTENKSIVLGKFADYDENMETAMVTDSAVFITYSETDTLYLHADTLQTVPDTIEGEKIVNAFHGVRFYRRDIQGLCDSLVYFTKDSLTQLHNQPVIWSDIHQLSADFIEMQQSTNAPDELHLMGNSFIISQQDSAQFDQIKGKTITTYFSSKIDSVYVDGNGQTLYYAREENEIIGLNNAESSEILIRFKDGKIHRIIFIKAPEGELKPLLDLNEEDKRLRGFDWKIEKRPLTKHDIFEKPVLKEEEKANEADQNEKSKD